MKATELLEVATALDAHASELAHKANDPAADPALATEVREYSDRLVRYSQEFRTLAIDLQQREHDIDFVQAAYA